MKTGSYLAILCATFLGTGTVRAQFVPGHVFAAQSAASQCTKQFQGGDRIWEINPETGEATLFVQIPEEMCGFLTGLAFTPDGSRLRASMWLRDEILEFDSEGNMSVALDATDGIACPWGFNNLAYDMEGDFYVVNECTRNILRFPADGGPPTVFADQADGVGIGGAIAFASDGNLYLTTFSLSTGNILLRIGADGNASLFENFGSIISPEGVTTDKSGHVYVGLETAEVFRYDAGNPQSKELLATLPFGGRYSMTMSPNQSNIYVNVGSRLFGIDVLDGTVSTLADFSEEGFLGTPAGIAVVPVPPPPIPTVSEWGMVVMTLLLLTAGALLLTRRWADRSCQSE